MLISAETDTGKTGTILRMVREHGARFLSDDMTMLHPDGRAGCFPKPLTISHHTLRAIGNDELSPRGVAAAAAAEPAALQGGPPVRDAAGRLNIPIMGVNALTQTVVPPPKYTVDRLLPCTIVPQTDGQRAVRDLPRRPHGAGELSRADAMNGPCWPTPRTPTSSRRSGSSPHPIMIGEDDHAELRRKEHAILASALCNLRCRWISTPGLQLGRPGPRTAARVPVQGRHGNRNGMTTAHRPRAAVDGCRRQRVSRASHAHDGATSTGKVRDPDRSSRAPVPAPGLHDVGAQQLRHGARRRETTW